MIDPPEGYDSWTRFCLFASGTRVLEELRNLSPEDLDMNWSEYARLRQTAASLAAQEEISRSLTAAWAKSNTDGVG